MYTESGHPTQTEMGIWSSHDGWMYETYFERYTKFTPTQLNLSLSTSNLSEPSRQDPLAAGLLVSCSPTAYPLHTNTHVPCLTFLRHTTTNSNLT